MPPAYTLPNVKNGRKTVASAGTAERLAAQTRCKMITLMGLESNTDKVVVGGAGVVAGTTADGAGTRTGLALGPGQSIALYVEDLSDIWLDVVVSGEGVEYIYQF